MRGLVLALIAVLSFAGSPVLAREESSFVGHFKTLCDAGEGDGERALALAKEAGWAQLPASMFAGQDNPFEQVTAMMNAEPDGTVVILVSGSMTEDFEGTPIRMAVCGLMGGDLEKGTPMAPDPGPIVRNWLAMAPHKDFSDQGMEGYAFVRNDEERRPVVSDAAGLQAALNGQLHVIMVGREENMSMLLYMRPRI